MAIKYLDVTERWERLGMGRAIAEFRKERGWTQDELRRELGVQGFKCGRTYIGLVETGQESPSIGLLIALEKVFDVEEGSLIVWAAFEHLMKFERKGLTLAESIELLFRVVTPGQIRQEIGEDELRKRTAEHGISEESYVDFLGSLRKIPPADIQRGADGFLQSLERTEEAKEQRRGRRRQRKGKG